MGTKPNYYLTVYVLFASHKRFKTTLYSNNKTDTLQNNLYLRVTIAVLRYNRVTIKQVLCELYSCYIHKNKTHRLGCM